MIIFRKIIAGLALTFILLGAAALPAFAQTPANSNTPGEYVLLAPLPYVATSSAGNDPSCTTNAPTGNCATTFTQYLVGIFQLTIALSAVLAVVMITYGGLEYVMSGVAGGKSDGKEKITNAIIGLLLVLASYLILYTINPNLTVLNFAVPAVTTTTTATNPASLCNTTTQVGCFVGGAASGEQMFGGGGANGSSAPLTNPSATTPAAATPSATTPAASTPASTGDDCGGNCGS